MMKAIIQSWPYDCWSSFQFWFLTLSRDLIAIDIEWLHPHWIITDHSLKKHNRNSDTSCKFERRSYWNVWSVCNQLLWFQIIWRTWGAVEYVCQIPEVEDSWRASIQRGISRARSVCHEYTRRGYSIHR